VDAVPDPLLLRKSGHTVSDSVSEVHFIAAIGCHLTD
jgi:hypothetical protein